MTIPCVGKTAGSFIPVPQTLIYERNLVSWRLEPTDVLETCAIRRQAAAVRTHVTKRRQKYQVFGMCLLTAY